MKEVDEQSQAMLGSIIQSLCRKARSHVVLVQERESGNQFQWQKIGYNQVKYRWRKLTNNPNQGLDRINHCAKKQDPMWFSSGMGVCKPIPMIENRL